MYSIANKLLFKDLSGEVAVCGAGPFGGSVSRDLRENITEGDGQGEL